MNQFSALLVNVIKSNFNTKVLNYLMRYVKDYDTAKDLRNQAVLQVLENYGTVSDNSNKYPTEEAVKSLIMRVATNLALDLLRKRKAWGIKSWDDILDTTLEKQFSSESRMKDDNLERLWLSYSKGELTPNERELFKLVAIGYENKELADIFGVTEGALNVRKSRMREKIKFFLLGVH